MKRKQLCSLITVALMATLVVPSNVKVQAKEKSSVAAASINASDVKCTYVPQSTQTQSNSITGSVFLENTSGKDLDLTGTTLNYYYSNDNNVTEEFHCYYAGTKNNIKGYQDFTNKITGTFKDNDKSSDPSKSRVCVMTFKEGTLPAGEKIEVQMSFNSQGWTGMFDQSNDFSFTNKVVGINEVDPGSGSTQVKEPKVSLNTTSYKRKTTNAVIATITDGELLKIKENGQEVSSSNYTNSGANVIFENSYLDGLSVGKHTFTFVFEGKEITKTLNVTKEKEEQPVEDAQKLTVNVGDVDASAGDEIVVPVSIEDFKSDYYAIENYEFVANYDSSKLEFVGVEAAGLTSGNTKLFQTKDAKDGSVKIQYLTEKAKQVIADNGVICNLKFKVKKNATGTAKVSLSNVAMSYYDSKEDKALNCETTVNEGKVTVKAPDEKRLIVNVGNVTKEKDQDEVVVPVSIADFKDDYDVIENYEFVANYDSSKLEFVGVEAAGLTSGNNKLFQTKDAKDGSVKIQYLTEKAKQVIGSDGVICNLKFKVKKNATGTAKVNVSDVALSYYDSKTDAALNYGTKVNAGSVKIGGGQETTDLGVVIGDITAKAGDTVDVPVKVKISGKSPVVGASVKIGNTDQYTIVGAQDNDDALEELGASNSYCSYIEKSKAALMYVIFDEGSFDGEYLLGTVKVKLNSNLAAGTKVKLNLTEVAFGDKNGKALDAIDNVGTINIDGKTDPVDPPVNPPVDPPVNPPVDPPVNPPVDPIEGAVNLEVANVTATVGGEVSVPVTLSDFDSDKDPIENYEFVANYDSSKLEFVGVEGAGLTAKYGKLFQIKDAKDGSVKVQYLTEKAKQVISENGVICNLKFKVKSNGTAKISLSNIALSYYDSEKDEADNYPVNAKSGSVTTGTGDETPTGQEKPAEQQKPTEQEKPQKQEALGVVIGDVTAKAGETVQVPVKVKISSATPAIGASVKILNSDEYSIVDVEDNDDALEELGASNSYCSYIKKSKTALMYVIFDEGSFDGEYLLGTVNVKLNSNLSSGTKVALKLTEIAFGDKAGKALDCSVNAGNIIIK